MGRWVRMSACMSAWAQRQARWKEAAINFCVYLTADNYAVVIVCRCWKLIGQVLFTYWTVSWRIALGVALLVDLYTALCRYYACASNTALAFLLNAMPSKFQWTAANAADCAAVAATTTAFSSPVPFSRAPIDRISCLAVACPLPTPLGYLIAQVSLVQTCYLLCQWCHCS